MGVVYYKQKSKKSNKNLGAPQPVICSALPESANIKTPENYEVVQILSLYVSKSENIVKKKK